MLARVPAGDLIDRMRHEPKLRAAEVLHSDTTWRPCTILAWARHRDTWAVLIRWPDGHDDWREYDPRNIRPGGGPVLRRQRPVIATAGPAKLGFLKELGADAAIDHTQPGWADQVRAAAPEGVDVILEAVGGRSVTSGGGGLAQAASACPLLSRVKPEWAA